MTHSGLKVNDKQWFHYMYCHEALRRFRTHSDGVFVALCVMIFPLLRPVDIKPKPIPTGIGQKKSVFPYF